METFLEILKYTIPALIVFLTAYLLVNSALEHITKKVEQERRFGFQKDTLPLRLQAYERLIIFLERNQLDALAMRLLDTELTLREYQSILIESIQSEFDHNLSQQIYVADQAWIAVRFVKDDTIRMMNMISASLPPDATSKDLAKKLIEVNGQGGSNTPAQKAIAIIHQEVKGMF
ncbi:hypothetical protein BH09BAC1_BH09BAC1_14390 [soil metagenome]